MEYIQKNVRALETVNKGIDVNSVTGYSVLYQKLFEFDRQTLSSG
jgi:hypothetical protein